MGYRILAIFCIGISSAIWITHAINLVDRSMRLLTFPRAVFSYLASLALKYFFKHCIFSALQAPLNLWMGSSHFFAIHFQAITRIIFDNNFATLWSLWLKSTIFLCPIILLSSFRKVSILTYLSPLIASQAILSAF